MPAKDLPFPKPIIVDLGDNPEIVHFDSSGELRDWIEVEADAWAGLKTFQPHLKISEPEEYKAIFRQMNHISGLKKAAKELSIMGRESPRYEKQLKLAESLLEPWRETAVLHSKSKAGKYILKQFDGATETAEKLTACRDLSEAIQVDLNPFADLDKKSMPKSVDKEKKRADSLDEQLSNLALKYESMENVAEKSRKQIDELGYILESQKSSIDQMAEDTETKLISITEAYEAGLATEAPVKYWQDKATHHTRLGAGLMAAFAALATIAGFAAYFGGSSLIELIANSSAALATADGKAPDPTWGILARVTIFILPAFLLVWILRIIARVGLVNLGLADDARERVAMTQSFLAFLSQEGRITEADKIVMLHSLFRPSALAGEDDAAPPNWFDLLAHRLGQSSK